MNMYAKHHPEWFFLHAALKNANDFLWPGVSYVYNKHPCTTITRHTLQTTPRITVTPCIFLGTYTDLLFPVFHHLLQLFSLTNHGCHSCLLSYQSHSLLTVACPSLFSTPGHICSRLYTIPVLFKVSVSHLSNIIPLIMSKLTLVTYIHLSSTLLGS